MRTCLLCLGLLIGSSTYAQTWVGLGMHANDALPIYKTSQNARVHEYKGRIKGGASLYFKRDLTQAHGHRIMNQNAILYELGIKALSVKNTGSNIIEEYDMSYLSNALIFRHYRKSRRKANMYYGIGGFSDYMLSGYQTEGFVETDISNHLKTINWGLVADTGLSYWIADDVYGVFGVSYNHGLTNLESGGETLKLHYIKIHLSAFFAL